MLARRGSAIALGVILLIVILLLTKFDLVFKQLQILYDFQAPALHRWQESWLSTFFFQIHPVITMSALFSICVAVIKRDAKYLIISWMVMLVLLLEIKRIRYSIVAFPMLAIMGSYGIAVLGSRETRKFIVSGTAVSAVLIAVFAYLPFLEKTSAINIQQAGKYLDSINIDMIDVYVLNQLESSINPSVTVPILDLFTDQELVYQEVGNSSNIPVDVDRHPLRWTWELSSPQYLREKPKGGNERRHAIVIQSSADQPLHEEIAKKISHYSLLKEFNVSDRAFKFQTIVRIFQPNRINTGEEPN